MDDSPPINGVPKTFLIWAMGVFSLLLIGTLGSFAYALFSNRFNPLQALEVGFPPTIGSAVVLFLITVFHPKLHSISLFRLMIGAALIFTLASGLMSAVLAFAVSHASRQFSMTLRLIMLVNSTWLLAFLSTLRKK